MNSKGTSRRKKRGGGGKSAVGWFVSNHSMSHSLKNASTTSRKLNREKQENEKSKSRNFWN